MRQYGGQIWAPIDGFGAIYGLVNHADPPAPGLLANMRNLQIEELARAKLFVPVLFSNTSCAP